MCMCVCICVYMDGWTCLPIHAHVEDRGWHQVSPPTILHSIFLRQGLSLKLGCPIETGLFGWWASGICLSLPSSLWGYRCAPSFLDFDMVLENQIQGFMLVQKVCPSPQPYLYDSFFFYPDHIKTWNGRRWNLCNYRGEKWEPGECKW